MLDAWQLKGKGPSDKISSTLETAAQLKESAADLFVSKPPDVMATAGWTRLGASADLLRELMPLVAGTKRPRDDDGEGAADRVKRMRVWELQKQLTDADLDTDGARAQLEGRLREHLGRGRAAGRAWSCTLS